MSDNTISENPAENSAENITEKNTKWHDLGQKVHELELLISSAGVYLSANLPTFLDDIWEYFNYHFSSDVSDIGFLSKIVYILLRSGAVTLWLGFICHFSLRAFWVAMIGLANIFPQGVNYEKLPKKFTNSYKDFLVTKLTNYERLISLTDRLSSSVLVIVFFLILILLGTAVIYSGILLVLYLFILILPDEIFRTYHSLFFVISLVLCFIIPIIKTIMILIKKRGAEHKEERKNELKYLSQTATLFGDTVYNITLILKSNMPKNQFSFILVGVIMMISAFGGLLITKNEKSTTISTRVIDLDMYENTRNNKKFVAKMSLNADVIKEKYVKIFIANPKELKQYTRHFEKFSVENLEKEERRKQKKIFQLAQWNKFFKIFVNGVPQEFELDFQTHLQTNTEGFVVYLPLSEPKIGKNIISIKIPAKDAKDTKTTETLWTETPFWYFP